MKGQMCGKRVSLISLILKISKEDEMEKNKLS